MAFGLNLHVKLITLFHKILNERTPSAIEQIARKKKKTIFTVWNSEQWMKTEEKIIDLLHLWFLNSQFFFRICSLRFAICHVIFYRILYIVKCLVPSSAPSIQSLAHHNKISNRKRRRCKWGDCKHWNRSEINGNWNKRRIEIMCCSYTNYMYVIRVCFGWLLLKKILSLSFWFFSFPLSWVHVCCFHSFTLFLKRLAMFVPNGFALFCYCLFIRSTNDIYI